MKYNKYIDYTLLKPETTRKQIEILCSNAAEHDYASVCVNTYWVEYCSELLKESNVNVCCVIGFPLGANTTPVKAYEAETAIANGADEVDMVINIGELITENNEAVLSDIKAVVKAAKGKCVKVILETCLLNDEQIVRACDLSMEAGAKFVKTSTGFSKAGADPRIVRLMKDAVKGKGLVKASGGIRDNETMMKMIEAGADRIGTSSIL